SSGTGTNRRAQRCQARCAASVVRQDGWLAPVLATPPPRRHRTLAAIAAASTPAGLPCFAAVVGRPLAMTLPAAELALEAGCAGALGGQVILQAEDVVLQAQNAQGRSQVVALIEQFPDALSEGQLAAGIAAVPACGPLRCDRSRGVQGAQERLLHPQRLG